MFEDIIEQELSKYEKFREELDDSVEAQSELLSQTRVSSIIFYFIRGYILMRLTSQSTYDSFIRSRQDDPAIKEREHGLQSLDLAYHKYREITRNLDEGLKVGRFDFLWNF